MELTYEIRSFSCYDNWTVKNEGENVSTVVDKLIRLAAKLTESYASDIFYDLRTYAKAVDRNTALDRVLFFRENGVSTYLVEDDVITRSDYLPKCAQVWRLKYEPETKTTVLQRVTLHADVSPWNRDLVGYGT